MLPSSLVWSWLTFGSSILSSAVAGVVSRQSSVPTAPSITPDTSTSSKSGESDAAISRDVYAYRTISAIKALQTWYDRDQGLFNSTSWWNSANCITVLGDFMAAHGDGAKDLDLTRVLANTFIQAQKTSKTTTKTLTAGQDGLRIVESHFDEQALEPSLVGRSGAKGFLNSYYDDEGWWAMAWIRAYDVVGNTEYLSMAEGIFRNMQTGLVNATCGGGIWWDKAKSYKNAIANELYLSVAASLANRVAHKDTYLTIAEGQWTWFEQSGLINSKNLINDGLAISADGSCVNNGGTTWSYNQGVILGGLVELYRATGNSSLLSKATDIAKAAIFALSKDGILHESCENNDCGGDGSQFKGIFMRNLQHLHGETHHNDFRAFILDNANSIWAHDRNASDYLGLNWAGPPSLGGSPNASTHSSATDALIAAMAVF